MESVKRRLRQLWDEMDGVLGKVRDLPPDVPDLLSDLSGRLSGIEKKITRVDEALNKAPQPFLWEELDAETFAEREQQVRDWVRDYLIARYGGPTGPGRFLKDRDCWWTHLDVRDYITSAWLSWTAAYLQAGRRHADPDDWLNVRLPRLNTALRDLIGERGGHCNSCEAAVPD
jgi:hypothetical protein